MTDMMMMMMTMMMMIMMMTSVTHCWRRKMCEVCSRLKCIVDTRANKHYRNGTGGTGECISCNNCTASVVDMVICMDRRRNDNDR